MSDAGAQRLAEQEGATLKQLLHSRGHVSDDEGGSQGWR